MESKLVRIQIQAKAEISATSNALAEMPNGQKFDIGNNSKFAQDNKSIKSLIIRQEFKFYYAHRI